MKYTLIQFKDEDFELAAATTTEETKQLGQVGFVKCNELNGISFYSKMLDLKVLMTEKAEFCLVGDDDSGPEDA